MKNLMMVAIAGAVIGLVGCDSGTTGGPGADKKNKSNLEKAEAKVIMTEDTFLLSPPTLSTKLKQGESEDVVIAIKRGKNFDEDVVLVFDELPKGVTADPASPAIKHGDDKVKISLKAKEDAALGDHTIKLKGKPTKGKEATNEVKVTVTKK